jgi:ADP-ribosyl-[dinitrogen reductase] hydrolase
MDRYRGALLGLAAGDALGMPLEFRPPGSFKPVSDMTGGGPFGLKPGQWTDDTSMALCLAESLVEKQGFDPIDQLERYLRWLRHGHMSSIGKCFDIGTTTHAALARFERTHEAYCGPTEPRSAGNGSIMRLASVSLAFARKPSEAIERSGESSRTTHGAAVCIDACRYLGALIVGAVNGAKKKDLLSDHYSPVEEYWRANHLVREIEEIASGSFRRQPPEIQGTGHVVKSLEAALWAFNESDTFKEGCLKAANLGDDADTTAAVYGQLAGAHYGTGGIPDEWLSMLAQRGLIESLADGLLTLSRRM